MVSVILPVATNLNPQSFEKEKISLTCHLRVFSPRRSERWSSYDDPSGFSEIPCRFRTSRHAEQCHANRCETLTADTPRSFRRRRYNRNTWTSRSILFTRPSNLLGKVFSPFYLSYRYYHLTILGTALLSGEQQACVVSTSARKRRRNTVLWRWLLDESTSARYRRCE